jgi:DNA polymerase III subunit alpha
MARKTARRNAPDLHCHSTFSVLDGFGTPKSVVERAVELGWGAACLTEHGWMGSAPSFYQAARAAKIKPIIGCEFYVVPDEILGVQGKETRYASKHLTVLALSREGYHNLVAWTSFSMRRENFYHKPRISIEAMIDHAPYPLHHNVVLSGCMGGELCQTIAELNGSALAAGIAYVDAMKTVWPNFYIELQHHAHEKFLGRGFDRYEEMVERQKLVGAVLAQVAKATGTPVVLTNDSHYQSSQQRKAHIAMLASKMNRWAKDEASGDNLDPVRGYIYWRSYMQSMEALESRVTGAEGACENVLDIVAEADIRLDPLDSFTYSVPDAGYEDKDTEIRRRMKPRLKKLKRKYGEEAVERIEHELRAMGDFKDYLLMMSDFIQHARREGILTNTRGSAANSLLCYALGIHNIDSIHYKLTFERFVNPERKKLPDIDIDIQYDRYEDFMAYVKEYVAAREGEGNIRLLCNYGTLANRSTFRMVAESLGIEKEKQDEIAGLLPQMIDSGLIDEEDDIWAALKEEYPDIYELASGVFDNIKSVGQHACGWVFGTRDRPLDEWVPQYLIASSGQLVSQYDYKQAMEFGYNKGDFLRLKMLTVISKCLSMSGLNPLDLESIPLDDEETFEMLRSGDTEGIFTLQGKTNRTGVMEVEAENEHDVIASVAIYRPSLTRPGYHKVYNRRRRGEEETEFPSDVAEEVLGESYGLPIFQEMILELGYAVGFSHGDAQELLDAIKLAKGIGRGAAEAFDKIKPKWIAAAMKNRGLSKQEAEETWEYVGSFQGYGFNRGHATSYGLLAVRAAYLKCHYPHNYFVSLLDTYPQHGRYLADARAHGFKILPPDINLSTAGYSKVGDKSIRVGLAAIDGIGPVALRAILAGQPFSSIDDLKERTPSSAVKVTTINNLAAAGAFSGFGVKGTPDDTEQFKLLGFLLDKPKAMEGCKPKHTRRRESSGGWRHLGYDPNVRLTDQRASVSKMFWIPELPEKELLKLKASAWARVKTYLLLAVDENGVAFHIMANEDKSEEAEYLRFIARKHRGNVICMEGSVRKPFDTDGPMGFRFFDVTGSYEGEPQVWGADDERMVKAFTVLHKRKRQARSRKGN